MQRGKERGFSLIELLIVVAIILIIAAIAIPNLMRARMAANEADAAASIRAINTAQYAYSVRFGNTPGLGYASGLTALGSPAGATCTPDINGITGECLLDNTLTSGTRDGYTFTTTVTVVGGFNTGYTVAASPTTPNQTGTRWFCSFQDAVVRVSNTPITAATCNGTVTPL